MVVKLSTALRNALAGSFETIIGADAILRLYSGEPPAAITDAATGVLLVEMELPTDWMGAPANGIIEKAGDWSGTGLVAGEAGYYRILESTGTTTHEQGTVDMTGEGADMTINNTNIAVDQNVSVVTFKKTSPGA